MLSLFLDSKKLKRITNHPVHIVDENGELSPTALVPFCEFGGNLSIMGVKIKQFGFPVCNSFKAKIVNDQLCYEVDPNDYAKSLNDKSVLELTLLVNYNEDRHTQSLEKKKKEDKFKKIKSFTVTKNVNSFITIGTISKLYSSIII